MIVIHTKYTRALDLPNKRQIAILKKCLFRPITSYCHRNCRDPRKARARAHQAAPHLYLQASCQLSGKRLMVWKYCMLVAGWGQTTRICRMPASITPSNPHPPYHRKIFCKHAPRLTLALCIMRPRQILHGCQIFTGMSRNLKMISTSLSDPQSV